MSLEQRGTEEWLQLNATGGDTAAAKAEEAEAEAQRRGLEIAFNKNVANLMRCCQPDDLGNLFGCYRRTGLLFSMCRPTPRVRPPPNAPVALRVPLVALRASSPGLRSPSICLFRSDDVHMTLS